jgi:polysaccharide export outer membrane protein
VRQDGTGPTEKHVIFQFDLTKADELFGARNFHVQPADIVIASESAVKPAQAVIALIGSMFAIANVFN